MAIAHLHELDVVHGNIYPDNLFVTDQGHATVVDALVYTLAKQFLLPPDTNAPLALRGSSAYQSPELLSTTCAQPMKATDVYAFASTVFAIFTGSAPFSAANSCNTGAVAVEDLLSRHLQIKKPASGIMCDGLWELLQSCWACDPARRPTMGQIVDALEEIELYN